MKISLCKEFFQQPNYFSLPETHTDAAIVPFCQIFFENHYGTDQGGKETTDRRSWKLTSRSAKLEPDIQISMNWSLHTKFAGPCPAKHVRNWYKWWYDSFCFLVRSAGHSFSFALGQWNSVSQIFSAVFRRQKVVHGSPMSNALQNTS